MNFTDRFLKCSDCGQDFVFTAGEQFFFFDKQFKNDPKRCKLCKAKRAGLGRTTGPNGAIALPLSRTETKTQCSSCGVDTTVPFKPTQGRPVLCRSCFQMKRVPTAVAATLETASEKAEMQAHVLEEAMASQAVDTGKLSMTGALPISKLFAAPTAMESELEPVLAGAGLNLC